MAEQKSIDTLIHASRKHIRNVRQQLHREDWQQSDTTAKLMTNTLEALRNQVCRQSSLNENTLMSLIALEREVRNTAALIRKTLNERRSAAMKVEQHQRALAKLGKELTSFPA